MHKPDDVIPAIERTLDDMNLHYLDAYLMQWPMAMKVRYYFDEIYS